MVSLSNTYRLIGASLLMFGCGGPSASTLGESQPASETSRESAPSGAEPHSSPSPAAPVEGEALQLFLLIGQSNMEGVPKPEAQDLEESPGVLSLGYDACGGRQWNQWSVAKPPLHRCWAGVGPGDYFGKAMADKMPGDTIGLIPCAISGVDIDFFRKGVVSKRRAEFEIPPDNKRDGAYDMVVERAKLAQQRGTIRGILFHQGESDTNDAAWPDKVAEIVADLKADLSLGQDVPFVAGELPYTGCCSSHNTWVNQLPSLIPNAFVVSADGLAIQDNYHFDLPGQRELGARYAKAMGEALNL